MASILDVPGAARLERSCSGPQRDWVRFGTGRPGLERMEAFFHGHAYDPHRHDTYAIGLTTAGVQRFDYRGVRADSTPGRVIVIHPDESHNGRAGSAGGFRYGMLYIEPRLIAEAMAGRASGLPFVPSPVVDDGRIRAALASALGDLQRPLEDLQADQVILAIAESLAAHDRSAPPRRLAPACLRAVERARDYLDAHIGATVASATLEQETGLDRYALARHFRARLGTSPYRYSIMRRLARARQLIAAGDTLPDTAFACGFADQSHMSRQFKQAFGITPGQWRKLL